MTYEEVIKQLGVQTVSNNKHVYYAPETETWYWLTKSDLEDLKKVIAFEKLGHTWYSFWCERMMLTQRAIVKRSLDRLQLNPVPESVEFLKQLLLDETEAERETWEDCFLAMLSKREKREFAA